MPPRLLLAPAGHGKTEHIIRRIRQVLADQPLAPVLVIVPNSIQAAGFRQRLVAAGGALGVEVYTFHALYAELLARAGQPIPLLTDPVRLRLLHNIVDDLCDQEKLPFSEEIKGGQPSIPRPLSPNFRGKGSRFKPFLGDSVAEKGQKKDFPALEGEGKGEGTIRHYAALRDKPGFMAALRNTIEELKRARILPEDFARATQDLEPRLGEIAAVYSAYQRWLQDNDWADNEGRGWLAAIALESRPELGTDARLLAVSGFDEFNPTQLGVLSLLAKRAQETLITLTGDIQRPQRPAHLRFQRAQNALTNSLNIQPEMLDSVSLLSPVIARTEAAIFEPGVVESVPLEDHDIEFIEAQTRSAEVRSVLRWIKARIVRDGLALSDVAIFARSLEPYRPYLDEVAAEFGVPLRVAGGLPLIENPAVSALLSLLCLPVDDWPRRGVMEAWTSPYFDFSGRDAASLLDEISRAAKVIKGLEQWREAFEAVKTRQETDDPEAEAKNPQISRIEGLLTCESSFYAFVDLLTPPENASSREFTGFVEAILGDDPAFTPGEPGGMNIVACARANSSTAERDMAALRAFKDVLRGLVLAEAVIGEETLPYAAFLAALRAVLETVSFSLPDQPGVMAASALDGRGLSFQAIALMGLSEGEFPKQEREDILLRERDRTALRERGLLLDTRLHGDEATLFYQAVTRGRQRLLLTRPYLAEDGQSWEPSPYWEQMHAFCGKPGVVRVRPEDRLDPTEAASSVEWREAAQEFDIYQKNGLEALAARLAPRAAGKFEGEGLDVSSRFGVKFGWSASKLESYGTCPFEFFVAYGLGLEPREEPEEGFDVRALGSMLHKILEESYRGADLRETAGRVFATAPRDYGFRPTPLWALQKAELLKRLEETVAGLAEVSQGWRPFRQELKFGMGAPSLELETEAGPVRLHGFIDRVDMANDGSLRVIDYKTGGAAISVAHLHEGRRLQLPIYALAVQKALGLGQVKSGFYWHIQKAEASSLKLEKFEDGINSAFAVAIAHVGRHVNGIRSGKFAPKPPTEGCPSYCPAAGFCWRYKKGF